MGFWTITYGGVEKTAADWGLNANPVIKTRDRSPTMFSFRMAGAAPEGAIPFPFKAEVTIKQNRTYNTGSGTWSGSGFVFVGYQSTQKGRVDGGKQGIMLDFQDVLWLLQNTTFQQIWKQYHLVGSTLTLVSVPTARVILFMDITSWVTAPWASKDIQWELNEIITYAASCGIAIQAGTIDYGGTFLNYYHVRAVSCWDAILKCVEPFPDAKIWVDTSTTPPSLQIRTRASIAAMSAPTTTAPGPITLPFRGVDSLRRSHFSTEFVPRYDLIPSQVVLQYLINETLNGKPYPQWTEDVYPPASTGQAPFALVVPIDLTGASITQEQGTLDCEALACIGGSQATKRAWWASKRGGEQGVLADYRVRFQDKTGAAVTLPDATVVDDTGAAIDLTQYPNRIVRGNYHAWMKNGTTPIVAIRAKISVQVSCAEYDVDGTTPADTDTNGHRTRFSGLRTFEAHVTLTNAPTGVQTYPGMHIDGQSETPVTGLAQALYTARQTLDYDGSHEIIDPGIVGSSPVIPLSQIIGHWNVLNFTGGLTAWATANMTVAGSEIDLMTNHQRIEIGPSKHLSPQDFNELLQYWRGRREFILSSVRATGQGDANQTVDMAQNSPDANTVPGLALDTALQLMNYTTENDPGSGVVSQIQIDAQQIPATQVSAHRPIGCCDDTGTLVTGYFQCTPPA